MCKKEEKCAIHICIIIDDYRFARQESVSVYETIQICFVISRILRNFYKLSKFNEYIARKGIVSSWSLSQFSL